MAFDVLSDLPAASTALSFAHGVVAPRLFCYYLAI
jgi:hypothetical protein